MKKIMLLFISLSFFIFGQVDQFKLFQQIQLKGTNSVFDSYFFIEDNWILNKDPIVDLDLSFSELTTIADSSLTFYINDTPIKSEWFKYIDKENSFLTLPKTLIKSGINKFSITKFQIIKGDCIQNTLNNANWTSINSAILNLDYSEDNSNINLGNFPLPYMSKYPNSIKKDIFIYMNQNPKDEEKLALANFSGLLGKINPNFNGKIIVDYIENYSTKNENSIYISDFDSLHKDIKKVFSLAESNSVKKELAFKSITESSGKQMLIITANKDKLVSGISSLFNENSLNQLNSVFINIPPAIITNKQVDNILSLENLGFGDIILKNNGESVSSINVKLPKDKTVSSLKLNLKFNFSSLLKDNNSTLKLLVNGRSLWDIVLDINNKTHEVIIDIPDELAQSGNLFIEFQTNLISEADCDKKTIPWVSVTKDTYLSGIFKDKDSFLLNDFPAPFIKNNKYNSLGISVSSDTNSLTFLAYLFYKMGSSVKFFGELKIYNKDSDGTSIIIGNPKSNPTLKELMDKLFVKYNYNFGSFVSNNEIQIFGDNLYSAMQLINNKNKTQLIFFTDENLYYDNLIKSIDNMELKGINYLGINENEGYYFYDDKLITNETDIKKDFNSQFIGIGLLIAVSLIFSFLIFFINRKNKF